jgi:hypothetical protein
VPAWLEGKVNKFLLNNSNEYAKAAEKVYPVNVASVYKAVDRNEISYDYGIKDQYDSYKRPSDSVVESLQFKGLEEILDVKKFSEVLRHLAKKNL